MEKNFHTFKNTLAHYAQNNPFSDSLKMHDDGNIAVYYSPFDAVNQSAKVCIVGISPGRTQAENANLCAQQAIHQNAPDAVILKRAKETASFSGALRSNLVALLDYVGLSTFWGLNTSAQLFSTHKDMLHSTSVFRYPTLVKGEPISSAQRGLSSALLKKMVDTYLASECRLLGRDVVYIPLGKGTDEILGYLSKQGVIKKNQVLTGFPHPSGANAERLAYFMGRKQKANLSVKTNSDNIDAAKETLLAQLRSLGVSTPAV